MNSEIEILETLANTVIHVQKARVASQVRLSHLAIAKRKCAITLEIKEKVEDLEKWIDGKMREQIKSHPAYEWFSQIKGVGDLNISKVVSSIDINRAENISKLWKYSGFCPGDRARKGQKLCFNMTLKTMCWRLAKSLIRAKGKYYEYYKKEKSALKQRHELNGQRIVPSKELPFIDGKRKDTNEFVGLGHIDMMAMRKMIKLFLSHLWIEWRNGANLEITKPYIHDIGGHSKYLSPQDMIE